MNIATVLKPFLKRTAEKRYLILKLGALGDVVMASTMLPLLRRTGENISVTWVAGRPAAELLALSGQVDTIICLDDNVILRGSFFSRLKAIVQLWRRIAFRFFDVCIVPYHDIRYHILRIFTLCGEVRSFRNRRACIPGRYHGVEYARLALGAGSECPDIPHLTTLQWDRIPQPSVTVPEVLLAPGSPSPSATDRERQWPLEHYVRLASLLHERGISVGLVGIDKSGAVEQAFAGIPVSSFINKTQGIAGILGVLRQARVLVAHDSGLIHLMTLCERACVCLFGPTVASEKVFPSARNCVVQAESPLPCMPCYDGRYYANCEERECLRQIAPERVASKVLSLLAGRMPEKQNRLQGRAA